MSNPSVSSSSLFVRPLKARETPAERRLELLKDRVELDEALSCLGAVDPLIEAKKELEQATAQFVADRKLTQELQAIVELIKPIGEIYFPSRDEAHLSEMLASIQKASENLPKSGAQKIAQVLARLRQLYLQEQKREPETAHQFSCSLQGLTTCYLYLSPQILQKMLPLDAKGGVVHSLKGVQGGGTRAVNRHGKIFCKDQPEAPLYQYGWDTFLQAFFDMNTAASQFACVHRKAENMSYHTQTSLAVDGDMSLSKLVTEQPHLLDKLDPDLFGRTAIAHMVGMPQDATENNFMCQFNRDSEGNIINIVWKGFDDDRWGVHSPCRSGKDYHFNNMRSIFLCFKQIYQPINARVRNHFKVMNPANGMLLFLKEMMEVNKQLKELLKNEKIPPEKMQEMFLPFLMVEDLVEKQYVKFCKIRDFMRLAPAGKTYMDLWKELDPILAHFYDMINKSYPNSPYGAFLKIFVRGGPTIEETLQSMLSRPLAQNIPLRDYLRSCSQGADDYESMRSTAPEDAAEKWLEKDLDLSIYSEEEQKEILKTLRQFPLSKITLRNCVLKEAKIRTMLQGQTHLQKLTLIGCPKISDKFLTAVFHQHANLELHLSNCKGITSEALSSYKSKRIVIKNPGEQPVAADRDARDPSFEPMNELATALEKSDWKQIEEHFGVLSATGCGPQAAIRIVEHMMTTDAMRKIVRENGMDALEFLKKIDFQFSFKNIKGDCLYHLCCEEDNTSMLGWLCKQPVNWQEVVDSKGATPFHVSVEKENIRCLEILKAAGAPINLQNNSNVGPLRLSIERKALMITFWLIQAGADLKEQNWRKQNLLHAACQLGLDEIVERLLHAAPGLADALDDMGQAPLNYAIEYGHAGCFHKVLKAMKSVQFVDKQGNTPLMLAVKHDRFEMVNALRKKGATAQDANQEGMNAVQMSALSGSLACLKTLLGENPIQEAISIVRKDGKTLLHLAALSGNEAAVKWLARPHMLTQLDEDGFAPAHYASAAGKWNVFFALLQAGFPIDHKTAKGETSLMLALRGHHFEMSENMIAGKADLNAVDNSNYHVIHHAAQNGDVGLIRHLREKHKIDVNLPTKNQFKKTPLHLASARGHLPAMQLLIDYGANKNACDRDDKTPLFLAVMNGQEEAVRLLIQNGADAGAVMKDGSTLLHYAAQYAQPKLVAYLLSLKPDLVNSRTIVIDDRTRTTHPHETALHSAMKQRIHTFKGSPTEKENMRQRQLEVVKTLLRFGAEVNARDRGDYTPLHLTAIEGRPDFARLLLSRGANAHAVYDKSKFGEGQNEKRTPEEHCYFWIDKLQRNPPRNENASDAAKRKKHIQEIAETAQLLKTHSKSMQNLQKNDVKKIGPLLANEKGLADLLRKPLQERKDTLMRNHDEDQGFRPESLLLLRSIEAELVQQPAQESTSFIQKLQESSKVSQMPSHLPALKYELPMTPQKIMECWLSQDGPLHLDDIACLIPLIEKPGEIFNILVELAETNLPEKQGKALFDLLTVLQGHEAWTAADFPKKSCSRLSKIKRLSAHTKEFDPSVRFPKVRLDSDWRKKNTAERKLKLEAEFSEGLKQPQKREETIDKLARALMGINREMLLQVRLSDFRTAKEASTALSELLRTSRDLSVNCLIFMMKGSDYDALSQRLEFIIAWMNKSALYGDYHQALALYEALSHPAVTRLKKGFDRIAENYKTQLLQLERLFSPEDAYRNYFSSVQQRLSPGIPAFSLYAQLIAQQESAPEGRFLLLQQIRHQRVLAHKLILPPTNSASEWLMALSMDLYPQEYWRKKEDTKPGDSFAWERSDLLKPRKLKSQGSFMNRLPIL